MAGSSNASVARSPSRLATGAGRTALAAMLSIGAAPFPSASTGHARRSIPEAAIDTRHEGREGGGAGTTGGRWGVREGGGGAEVRWLVRDTVRINAFSPSSATPSAVLILPPPHAVRGPFVGMWVPVNLAGTINSGINIPLDPPFPHFAASTNMVMVVSLFLIRETISTGSPTVDSVADVHGDLDGST